MINKNKQTINKISIAILLILLQILFWESKPVSADSAPPPGAVGSDLYPSDNATKVRMESETVVIKIVEHNEMWDGYSIVTATFNMRNLGSETESMKARFPMNLSPYDFTYEQMYETEYCQYTALPDLQDLSVSVNGERLNTEISTSSIETRSSTPDNPSYIDFNCWANFDITFPPDELVTIQISYKVDGYKWTYNVVNYRYILQTGIGWAGTIGTADIIAELPYDVNNSNLIECTPSDCKINEKKIIWHYEDFEPDENIYFTIVDPYIWSEILRQTTNVQQNPNNGEAWGILATSYRNSITEKHGYILLDQYPNSFEKAMDAFHHAISLLPADVKWHWEYANTVCNLGLWNYGFDENLIESYQDECAKELEVVLDLNPEYDYVKTYIERLYKYHPEFVTKYELNDYYGFSYLLTPTATRTNIPPTITPSITITKTSTKSPYPTKTEIENTDTHVSPTIPLTQSGNPEQNRLLFAVGANILFIMLFLFAIRSDQPNQ